MNIAELSAMIVDDDEVMLEATSLSLIRLGMQSITRHSRGEQALAALDEGLSVDVLLLDLNMPGMDGIEVLRNLVSRGFMGGVVLFSGEDNRILKAAQNLASAHGLHVLGSLQKPVTQQQLEDVLGSYEPDNYTQNHSQLHEVTVDELREALQHQQIIPYFQPKISLKDRSLVSAEVLARWHHPDKGVIPPIVFIPVAEEYSLIDELTWSIYRQSIAHLQAWRELDPNFTLGLNLSVDSLATVDLPEKLGELISSGNIPCQAIVLEITESRLMQNIVTALDVLTRLCLKGFRLSIDDFGTGYSSMSQLSNIPFAELKIDRSFVHGSSHDTSSFAIMEASASLAKKLNMTVVAEGVENEKDLHQITHVGCDVAQGYYFAKPMPLEEFDKWKQQWAQQN